MPLPKLPHTTNVTPPEQTTGIRPRSVSMNAIPRPQATAPQPASPQPAGGAPAGQPAPAPQTLPNGTVLQNRYTIEAVLGTGGMSVVYRGRDLRFTQVTRYCAIKEMFQTAPDSATRMLRFTHFEREAGILATLSHPAIPKVYDFFEEHGRIYVIMELADFCQYRLKLWALIAIPDQGA